MKVLIVSHGFQTHYTTGFVNALYRSGVRPVLIRSSNLSPELLDDGIESHDFGQNMGGEKPWRKVLRFLRYHVLVLKEAMSFRYEVIHVVGLLQRALVTGLLHGLWYRCCGKKYVLTVHNLLPHDRHTALRKHFYRYIYRLPNILMVHTDGMKAELAAAFSVPNEKIIVVEHGINEEVPMTQLSREEARASLELGLDYPESICLLFFGNILPYKGLDVLVEAMAELPATFRLMIAGRCGDEDYKRLIDASIAGSPARDRITLNDQWIDDSDIEAYFKGADLLVLPYRHIDQSGLLFLSFRFGLPVVASDVGTFAQYLPEGVGSLVPAENPSALATMLLVSHPSLCQNRDRIKQYGEQFLWKNTVKCLVDEY